MRSIPQLARSAWRLRSGERAALRRAFGWLLLARIALSVTQYSTLLAPLNRLKPARRTGISVDDCRLALQRATRLQPGATCLPQAVAAAAFVRREGHTAEFVLHVHLSDRRQFEAHASLVAGGVVITGDGVAAQWPAIAQHTIGA